jgi:hypothetical protein
LEVKKRDQEGELPTWIMVTTNIRRFSFSDLTLVHQKQPQRRIGKLVVDGTSFDMSEIVMSGSYSFVRNEGQSSKTGQLWKVRVGHSNAQKVASGSSPSKPGTDMLLIALFSSRFRRMMDGSSWRDIRKHTDLRSKS